jgi:hypothetical protein
VAPVAELQVEQYMAVAEDLASQADLQGLLPCDPAVSGEMECARAFVAAFGPRAFRRPLTDELEADLISAYELAAGDGFEAGVRFVIETALQSPYFLYHVELTPEDAEGLARLDGYTLASRLSYFLWQSMPDDALFEAAALGKLDSVGGLRAEAERLLEDDRAADAIADFHLQWLGLRALEQLEKDPTLFPTFDDAMRAAMRLETTRFTDHVVRRGGGTLASLFTSSESFPSGSLAALYGSSEAGADPVALDPAERGGLLTQASLLATHAHPDQTSPVHRGVLVRERILCQDLPPPPENVNNVAPEPDPNLTTRERFAVHTEDPTCAQCHKLIDGIGFAFERYDALGAYRATENGKPVDDSGMLIATDDVDGEIHGALELGELLAKSETVHRCVVRQWFRFAFGRMEDEQDASQLDAIDDSFAASSQDLRQLLVDIVTSDAFAYRRVDAPTTETP